MKELVLDIAKALVDNPDAVVVKKTKKGSYFRPFFKTLSTISKK